MPLHATLEGVIIMAAHHSITSLISRVVIVNFGILVASKISKLLKLLKKTLKIRDSER